MPLTRTITTTTQKTVNVVPYSHWGCFTSKSNISLRKKAETLVKKAETASTLSQFRSACLSFVRGWRRMCQNPSHNDSGVSDSAVREYVWMFLLEVAETGGYSYNWADDVWKESDTNQWKVRRAS